MIKVLRLVLAIAIINLNSNILNAKSIGVNASCALAASSVILDVSSTEKGMLVHRLSKLQKNAIKSPVTGSLIYQGSFYSIGFHSFNGSKWNWIDLASRKAGWFITVNSGTDTAIHFLEKYK